MVRGGHITRFGSSKAKVGRPPALWAALVLIGPSLAAASLL